MLRDKIVYETEYSLPPTTSNPALHSSHSTPIIERHNRSEGSPKSFCSAENRFRRQSSVDDLSIFGRIFSNVRKTWYENSLLKRHIQRYPDDDTDEVYCWKNKFLFFFRLLLRMKYEI